MTITKSRPWFEKHRQSWIAEMLNIYGFINRGHLMKKFEISMPQASSDLQRFFRSHRTGIAYDLSRKCYVKVAGVCAKD